MKLSDIFERGAEVSICIEGHAAPGSETAAFPTRDPKLNETVKTLLTAFAEKNLSGTHTQGSMSDACVVRVNDVDIYRVYPRGRIPEEIQQLSDAIHRANRMWWG